MNPRNLFCTLLLVSCAPWMSSCSLDSSSRQLAAYHAYDLPAKLPQDPGKVRVKVSLSRQMTYVMEGDRMLLAMPVSIGKPGSPTPTGSFRIFYKKHHHRANSHGYAYQGDAVKSTYLAKLPRGWKFKGTPMPYWCEFKPHYGFHTGWMKDAPCTHGCIRMHENVSPKFFRLVSLGTPVSIAYSQPEDASHGNVPRPPDAGPLPDYDAAMYLGQGYFTRHKEPSFE